MMNIADIYNIFSNFVCPLCGERFDLNDFNIVRDEGDGIFVLNIRCKMCAKSFAVGLFGLNRGEILNLKKQNLPPITEEEVKKISENFKNFEKNWYNFIKKRDF